MEPGGARRSLAGCLHRGYNFAGAQSGGGLALGLDVDGLRGCGVPDCGPCTCVSTGWDGGASHLHCRKACFRASLFLVLTQSSR